MIQIPKTTKNEVRFEKTFHGLTQDERVDIVRTILQILATPSACLDLIHKASWLRAASVLPTGLPVIRYDRF